MTKLKEAGGSALKGVDPSVRRAIDLRNMVETIHWTHQNQILDMLDLVSCTDRQFEKLRSRTLRIINDEARALRAVVNRAFGPEEGDGHGR